MSEHEPKPAGAYHHGDLRQALLQVALVQVEREGVEAISLAALARKVGVSQAAPYRHFPDRDALLAAVAEEAFKMFHASLTDAVTAAKRGDSRRRMCRAYVDFGLARPGLYRLMFGSRILARAAPEDAFKILARRCFRLLLESAARSRSKRARERDALKIWMGLHGLVMLVQQDLIDNGPVPITIDEMIDTILE